MEGTTLSPTADALIEAFEKQEPTIDEEKIAVNPLISKVATWYERLRNVMDYREEEVILRAAIERILKRRLLLGGNGKTVAAPLIRELVWARYFSDNQLSESVIEKVEREIDLFLRFREEVLTAHKLSESVVNEWTYQLMSARIAHIVRSQKEKEVVANFMFRIMREHVTILDDTEQTKDVQVFIAVRRSFAKDDLAFLRYNLFTQLFGTLQHNSIASVAQRFGEALLEVARQLRYPRKDTIYSFVKNKTAAFFILEDLLRVNKGNVRALVRTPDAFGKAVFAACESRYSGIAGKVRRAIIRSVIFIFLTKMFFALAVEGAVENLIYGHVFWPAILLNTTIPPLSMVLVGLFIQPPGRRNTQRILTYLQTILFDEQPKLGTPLTIKVTKDKRNVLDTVFTILWFSSFILAFGLIIFVLTRLNFRLMSQAVFIFFLAIVSFLSYRIGLMSRVYTVDGKQGIVTPVVDFLLMPIVKVGRHLTEGIAQINIILFVFDFIIEAPFKGLFTFFEQWFLFLHAKREGLE